MANKVSNSKIAYYIKDAKSEKQLITTDDALMYASEGIVLRDHLYDVEAYDNNEEVRLKFVASVKRANYFATKASGYKCEAKSERDTTDRSTLLHNRAKKLLLDADYEKIQMGEFKICNEYITSVDAEVLLQFTDNEHNPYSIQPDIIISTQFQDIFVEIYVTHEVDDNKLDVYKKYRQFGNHPNAFSVFEIDLSDLQKSVIEGGYTDEINKEVEERVLGVSEYKKMLPLISFDLEDAPFGWCKRTGLPYKLLINKASDQISGGLDYLYNRNSAIKTSIIEGNFGGGGDDEHPKIFYDDYNMLFLVDESPEHPLMPLTCIEHYEIPLKLVKRTDAGKLAGTLYLKCDLNETREAVQTKNDVSLCDFTCTFCSNIGIFSDEYLILGDLSNLLSRNTSIMDRINIYRKNVSKFRRLEEESKAGK